MTDSPTPETPDGGRVCRYPDINPEDMCTAGYPHAGGVCGPAPVPPSTTPSRCGVHGPGGVGPCTCDETPSRSVHLLLSDLTLLEAWSDELRATIQQGLIGVYLVGSSLRTSDYRDVDVRIVVDDADHLSLECAVDLTRLHLALSLWGQRATGLPIDCQTQSLTESGAETGPIRPLNRKGRR